MSNDEDPDVSRLCKCLERLCYGTCIGTALLTVALLALTVILLIG